MKNTWYTIKNNPEWMKINGIEEKRESTNEELEDLVAKSPYYKATANDADWMEKVWMQGEVQKNGLTIQ